MKGKTPDEVTKELQSSGFKQEDIERLVAHKVCDLH